jgi:hypothetical protein
MIAQAGWWAGGRGFRCAAPPPRAQHRVVLGTAHPRGQLPTRPRPDRELIAVERHKHRVQVRGDRPAHTLAGSHQPARPATRSAANPGMPKGLNHKLRADHHNPDPQCCWTVPGQRGYLAVTMSVLVSRLDPGSDAYRANCSAKLRLVEEFAAQSRVGDLKRHVLATGAWHRAVALPLGEGEGHRRLRRVPDVITKGLVANRGKLTREGRTADTFMGRSRRPNSSAAHGDRLDCEQLAFGLLPNADGRPSSKASHLVADNEGLLTCGEKWIDPGGVGTCE